jgi:predicted Zn-ribbon and HTH transcriptional regulator
METKIQSISNMIDGYAATPREISQHLGISEEDVFDYMKGVKKTTDRTLLVKPPECNNCNFSEFDKILNNPSKCPECTSESLTPPEFMLE